MTDLELQRAVAQMLPEKIIAPVPKAVTFFWQRTDIDDLDIDVRRIKDTEWLHIVWLIEQGLTQTEADKYCNELDVVCLGAYGLVHASWQQRAQALIATLGEKKGEK